MLSSKESVWTRVFRGDGFVRVAFEAARKADPSAKLFVNDFK
jgi:GH35 family endo-1,4-beta-xylanase